MRGMDVALLTGLGLGVFVAAQVGPIWLLCARSSLRYGARSGLAIGAGGALVGFWYAVLARASVWLVAGRGGRAPAPPPPRLAPAGGGLPRGGPCASFLCWLGGR